MVPFWNLLLKIQLTLRSIVKKAKGKEGARQILLPACKKKKITNNFSQKGFGIATEKDQLGNPQKIGIKEFGY